MPILGAFPVIDRPEQIDTSFWDTRTLAFRSLDGSTLMPFAGREFIARKEITGLDLIEPEIIDSPIPGLDGTRIEEIRIGPRKVFLPVWIGSDSGHAAYLDRRDELVRLFNHHVIDYRDNDGTFDLVAESIRGQRSLRCLYASGMEGNLAADSAGSYWESIGLNLFAARPYWTGEPWSTPVIRRPDAARWFGTFPPRLSASQAIGQSIPISVTGDAPSYATLDLVGPASSVMITAPRLSISIPGGLAAGESAQIVTGPRKKALFSGVTDWSRIAPTDRYFPLPPGDQTISLVMTGMSAESAAVVSGESRFARPW